MSNVGYTLYKNVMIMPHTELFPPPQFSHSVVPHFTPSLFHHYYNIIHIPQGDLGGVYTYSIRYPAFITRFNMD